MFRKRITAIFLGGRQQGAKTSSRAEGSELNSSTQRGESRLQRCTPKSTSMGAEAELGGAAEEAEQRAGGDGEAAEDGHMGAAWSGE